MASLPAVQKPLCINLPALALDIRATEHVYVLVPAFEDRDACTDVMAGPSILRTLAPGQLGLRKPKPVLHWPTAALHSLGGRGGWQPLHVESGQRLQRASHTRTLEWLILSSLTSSRVATVIGRGVPIYDVLFKQKECPDKYASSERRPPPSSVVWEIRIDPADQVLRHPTMAPDPSFHLELHYHLADLPCPEYQPMPRAVLSHFHPSQHFLPAHRHRSVVPSPYSTGVQGIAVHGADEFQGNPFYG